MLREFTGDIHGFINAVRPKVRDAKILVNQAKGYTEKSFAPELTKLEQILGDALKQIDSLSEKSPR